MFVRGADSETGGSGVRSGTAGGRGPMRSSSSTGHKVLVVLTALSVLMIELVVMRHVAADTASATSVVPTSPIQLGMYTGGSSDATNAPGVAYPGACARDRWMYG